MSEICVNCGQNVCADANVCNTVFENAKWGEVGFDLPYAFNKVYFCDGVVVMNEGIEPKEEPTQEPEQEETPSAGE